MAKRWYYRDEQGNKVATPQYKVNSQNHYTKAETDAKFAKLDNTSQTISVAQIYLGEHKYDMWTDDDGYLWVNGEKYVSEGNEATHLVAEKVTSPQVNTDSVWFSENEDVLDVQGGKLKLNGESVSEEEVYIGSGTPPTEAKIAIDPSEDLVEIVQEVGTATDKVMSQKAVTDALANIPSGGGDWKLVADTTTTEEVSSFTFDFDSCKELSVLFYTPKNANNTASKTFRFTMNDVSISQSGNWNPNSGGLSNALANGDANMFVVSIKSHIDTFVESISRFQGAYVSGVSAIYYGSPSAHKLNVSHNFTPDVSGGISRINIFGENSQFLFASGTIIKIYGR